MPTERERWAALDVGLTVEESGLGGALSSMELLVERVG
jgi:hypothetical protein